MFKERTIGIAIDNLLRLIFLPSATLSLSSEIEVVEDPTWADLIKVKKSPRYR